MCGCPRRLRDPSGERRRGGPGCTERFDQRGTGALNAALVAASVRAAERRAIAVGHEHIAWFERRDAGRVPA